MEIYTAAELKTQIQAVDAEITATMKVADYRLDTGQSSQRVARQSLSSLVKYRAQLVARYCAVLRGGSVSYMNAGR